MARFLVKASEFKNVCKAVNDRKLAELKKEIIEILKKQDEKEVKKAIDYFNSQELHYTHLEKSLVSGKWIEKAGYGVGTVRIWKGKKYKKIAPGKWARVFDKEGRGTNIAIGKLIARVNKIDNAEDLLQFVMENKQRFVDEDGRELGILDKVRAAVDTRSEKLSGESSTYVYGVGENVNRAKNEMFSKKDKITKEEADLHKVSRKLSQIPTTELKQEKARLERAVANKTRSKRDSLNNTIFRESNQEKLDAINKELEKRSQIKAEKTVEEKIKENPDYPFKPKTDKERAERAAFEKDRDDFIERMDKIRQENKKKDSKPAEKKSPEKLLKEMGFETMEKVSFNGDKWEVAGVSLDYNGNANGISLTPDRQAGNLHSSNVTVFDIDKIQKNKPAEKKEDENKTYWIQDNRGNRLTNEDAKKKIIGQMKYLAELEDMAGKKLNNRTANDIRYYIDYLKDRLNPEDRKEVESEAEKLIDYSKNQETKVGGNKETIGNFTKSGERFVEMPATKETKEMFETLNKFRSNEKSRPYMTEVYYDGDRLISTDGRRLAYIKVGDLGFDKGHVRINTEGDKISIMEMPEWSKENPYFPNVEKVIPVNNKQEIKLNNKVLKDKLKAMKKDGAYSKNSGNRVTLEFEDGRVLLDGTVVGTGNIDFGDKEKFMNFNAQFLMDSALTGDNASMFVSEDPTKAVSISTNSSDTIIMPMSNAEKVDYSKGRSSKEKEKTEKEEAIARNKKFNNELCKVFESRYGYDLVKNMVEHIDERLPSLSDEQLQREYTRLGLNFDKLMGKNATTINTVLDKKTSTDLKTAYLYSRVMKEHPEVKDKIVAELEKRGITVKKSLFDDFIMDVFAADDEEELEEELEEGETEYNDYSAEQPELFNSTELKVREAYDRVCNCIM